MAEKTSILSSGTLSEAGVAFMDAHTQKHIRQPERIAQKLNGQVNKQQAGQQKT